MKNPKTYNLGRNKSLKSKKIIEQLFQQGTSIVEFPLRLVFLPVDFKSDELFLTAFSVPKKKFKKAVDRNRIKRLMRESFRLQQHNLDLPRKTVMMWIYMSDKMPDYAQVYKKMSKIIEQLNQKIK